MGLTLILWLLFGWFTFVKSTSTQEREIFIDEFNYSNIFEKFVWCFLMFLILLLQPIAKICEFLEGDEK